MAEKKNEEEIKENNLTFHEKFLALISELKVPKNQFNNFGKYNYRSAEDILEGVKPTAIKYGLIPSLSDEIIQIGDRYYIKATASISDGEKTLSSTGLAREEETKKGMDGSQITGTASSYARKYAMNGLYQIDDTKDADTDEFGNQQNKGTSSNDSKASSKQVGMLKAKIMEYCQLKNGDQSQFENFLTQQYQVKSIYDADKQTTSNMIQFVTEKLG